MSSRCSINANSLFLPSESSSASRKSRKQGSDRKEIKWC